jgi:hypothetical protein
MNMTNLNPEKLHVNFIDSANPEAPLTPRAYTLTHSDATGELSLSIGLHCNRSQIAGLYTRLMRDEVWAEWKLDDQIALYVHCHVSGGLVVGTAKWRDSIFRQHLPMVLQVFWYGDQKLTALNPQLAKAAVIVYFHARQKKLNRTETWGVFGDYKP